MIFKFKLSMNSHEMMSKAALHHDPVHSSGQVDVRRQENNVLALQRRYGLVHLHQVRHHLLERSLPLAAGPRAGAGIRPKLARLLVLGFLSVQECSSTA